MKIITTEIKDGFVEPKITPSDYISGGERSIELKLGQAEEVIMSDGDWSKVAIEDEVQSKGYDTFGCTIFNTLAQVETYLKGKFGIDENYSDRFTYNEAEITPPGADPNRAYESIRNKGVILESDLPWDADTLEDYSNPRPPLPEHFSKAKEWWNKYVLKHEYLPRTDGKVTIETIKNELTKSPVALAVQAWSFNGEKYVRTGADTHWTLCIGTYPDGDLKLRDSYEPFIKRIDKDFGIFWAKKIWIGKREEQVKWYLTIIKDTLEIIKSIYEILLKQKNIPIEPPKDPWAVPNPSNKWAIYPADKKLGLIRATRDICFENGLSADETKELIATVQGESGWNPYCENRTSLDYGVAQFSQRYYLVEYKMTPQYAKEHPIECLTIMAKNWKTRKRNWVAFSGGGFSQWLPYSDQQLADFKPSWGSLGSIVQDALDFFHKPVLGLARSSSWRKVRNEFLVKNPHCAITGSKKNVEIHHKKPFYLNPELELEPSNLIPLRRDVHLIVGHLGSWSSYNSDIEQDAEMWYNRFKGRP